MRWWVLGAALCTFATAVEASDGCEAWGTGPFFEDASLERVAACLQGGARLDMRDEVGETPLHWAAARSPDARVVTRLLYAMNAAEIDVNLRREDGRTALHMAAAEARDPAVIVTLALNGADLDLMAGSDEEGWFPWGRERGDTALHLAAAREDGAPMVAALLAAGADADQLDRQGRSALHHAVRRTDDPARAELLLLADPDEANRGDEAGGFTPLHVAAETAEGHWVVAALLSHGADADETTGAGQTPLHMAAAYNDDVRVLSMLTAAMDDACIENEDGAQALDYAAENAALKGSEAYWRLHDLCYGE